VNCVFNHFPSCIICSFTEDVTAESVLSFDSHDVVALLLGPWIRQLPRCRTWRSRYT